jgi:hypothetical protein
LAGPELVLRLGLPLLLHQLPLRGLLKQILELLFRDGLSLALLLGPSELILDPLAVNLMLLFDLGLTLLHYQPLLLRLFLCFALQYQFLSLLALLNLLRGHLRECAG